MAIEKQSLEWNLGLLKGFAMGGGQEEIIAAADFVVAQHNEPAPDGGAEQEEIEPRTGRWQKDELEILRRMIAADETDEEIQASLAPFGRGEEKIQAKIDEERAK